MKKDIEFRKVEDLGLCIIPDELPEQPWILLLINFRDSPIQNVIVNSVGYDNEVRTSRLRYFIENVPQSSFVNVELVPHELFNFTNEYHVSFSFDNYLYDKKYVFVKGSLSETNFTEIPLVGKRGVLIK